jgi:hypothetical protein
MKLSILGATRKISREIFIVMGNINSRVAVLPVLMFKTGSENIPCYSNILHAVILLYILFGLNHCMCFVLRFFRLVFI